MTRSEFIKTVRICGFQTAAQLANGFHIPLDTCLTWLKPLDLQLAN